VDPSGHRFVDEDNSAGYSCGNGPGQAACVGSLETPVHDAVYPAAYGPLKNMPIGTTVKEIEATKAAPIDLFIPNNGTASLGIAATGGAGMYGGVGIGFLHIDRDGNIVLGSFSISSGLVDAATGTASGYYMRTDAKIVTDLGGWSVNAGASVYEGLGLGYDWIMAKNYETGDIFTGDSYNIGLGANLSPLPPTEIHGGFSFTWLSNLRFNIYDVFSLPRPSMR